MDIELELQSRMLICTKRKRKKENFVIHTQSISCRVIVLKIKVTIDVVKYPLRVKDGLSPTKGSKYPTSRYYHIATCDYVTVSAS